jgi:hypothetical protein
MDGLTDGRRTRGNGQNGIQETAIFKNQNRQYKNLSFLKIVIFWHPLESLSNNF